LQNLKKLGFQTYSELWDESYDFEINWQHRIDKIVNLVESLKTFDWDYHKEKIIKISNHNKLNFLNLNHIADNEFYNFEEQITKFL
jgi:hypothetical protein